jgi:hypothetical protein
MQASLCCPTAPGALVPAVMRVSDPGLELSGRIGYAHMGRGLSPVDQCQDVQHSGHIRVVMA